MKSIQFMDAFRSGAGDASMVLLNAFNSAAAGTHIWLTHVGLPVSVQTWFAITLLIFSVVLMMNQFRYLVRGGFIMVASLTVLELIKPALLAIAAGVLFVSH